MPNDEQVLLSTAIILKNSIAHKKGIMSIFGRGATVEALVCGLELRAPIFFCPVSARGC